MTSVPRGHDNAAEICLLSEAFDSFSGAATKFERYYRRLEDRVRELDLELRNKNEVLEKSLREREEVKSHLYNILESLTSGVVVVDPKRKITTFNRAAENTTHLSAERVIGKDFEEVFPLGFLDDSMLNFKSLNNLQERGEVETEIDNGHQDIFHLSLSVSSLRNQDSENIGMVITFQDITRMKRLEEEASRTDRLAAMGEMAANIVHEIRNPLGSIELFATALKKDLEEFKWLRAPVEHISSGVHTINSIVSNLLLFVRPQQRPDFHVFDIHESLNDSLSFSSHLIGSHDRIEVVNRFYPGPLPVCGDPVLLKQALLNLLLNAIQAMPVGGSLVISTRKIDSGKDGSRFAEIRFADTGTGIAKRDIHRVFDPFFTTKKGGTGLGLGIVHNIIKLHGGEVDIVSTEGEGTVIVLTLPLKNG